MKNFIRGAVFAALLVPAIVFAQDGAKPERKGNPFGKMDTNKDGKISKEEFLASPMAQKNPERAEARFAKLDTDKDGFLSADELKAGAAAGREGGHKKKNADGN